MLALSGVALFCVLERVAKGLMSNCGNTLHFDSANYGGLFKAFWTAMVALSSYNLDEVRIPFNERLELLHFQGMQKLATKGPESPQKVPPVAIPPSVRATALPQPPPPPCFEAASMAPQAGPSGSCQYPSSTQATGVGIELLGSSSGSYASGRYISGSRPQAAGSFHYTSTTPSDSQPQASTSYGQPAFSYDLDLSDVF